MQTGFLFEMPELCVPDFAGAAYDPGRDKQRLTTQYAAIVELMSDGEWRTVDQAVDALRKRYPHINFPAPSVSAQLRNTRKVGIRMEARNSRKPGEGYLCEYRLVREVQA